LPIIRLRGVQAGVGNARELVIVNTPYIVAYRIKDRSTIEILAILHGKRRWPDSF
jgi:plasmid stabilization system protein ParE